MVKQLEYIKALITDTQELCPKISLEGVYQSTGARYYIAFELEEQYEACLVVIDRGRGCDRLRNKPRNDFKRINIDEEIIKLQQKIEEIADHKEQGLPPT